MRIGKVFIAFRDSNGFRDTISSILNRKDLTSNTPLHYATEKCPESIIRWVWLKDNFNIAHSLHLKYREMSIFNFYSKNWIIVMIKLTIYIMCVLRILNLETAYNSSNFLNTWLLIAMHVLHTYMYIASLKFYGYRSTLQSIFSEFCYSAAPTLGSRTFGENFLFLG